MKKITKCALAVAVVLFSNPITKAQVTTLGNTGALTDYVGWANTQAFPPLVEHKGAYPINFSTKGSQKATILSNGNFGIGSKNVRTNGLCSL
jgi:hypothetical protein